MSKFIRCVLVPIALIFVILSAAKFYHGIGNKATIDNLKYIAKHVNSAGRIVDYQGDIGVRSIDDVKLYVKDDSVRIEFGKILLEWRYDDFLDEKYDGVLERIGLYREIDKKTNELKVYYLEEELVRWAS